MPEKPASPEAEIGALFERLEQAPDDLRIKRRLARQLQLHRKAVPPVRENLLHGMLVDPDIDPDYISPAAWNLLATLGRIPDADDPAAVAAWVEADALARDLLAGSPVATLEAELPLTAARRWLLLNNAWHDHPATAAALCAQVALNGGAWPFDEGERERLAAGVPDEMLLAYLPKLPDLGADIMDGTPVTQRVAAQYRRWPYPVWSRPMASEPSSLAHLVASIDPDGPLTQASPETLLVAGCGTGWEAAIWARRYPDARIVAIDISATSLDFAKTRCRALGLDNLQFEMLDLNQIAQLGQKFDIIVSSGVLHHLEDPEAGWTALVDALVPGGIMRLMVYSRIARLGIEALRRQLADLRAKPVDDDVLREARARLIARYPGRMNNADYFTLGGMHDLLFNVQEDAFDIPRIERGIKAQDLVFLGFLLPDGFSHAHYLMRYPDDPRQRDFGNWQQLEIENPLLFEGMYGFWCRKPGTSQ